MKKITFCILMIISAHILIAADSDYTVVTVNGYEITSAEIDYELGQLEHQAMIAGEMNSIPLNYNNIEELRDAVIETLINKHLLLQECRRRKIAISEKVIIENILTLKNQFPTTQQYYDFLASSGITEAKLKDEILNALMIDTLAYLESEKNQKNLSSEEKKQEALVILLKTLHNEADIIRAE